MGIYIKWKLTGSGIMYNFVIKFFAIQAMYR